MKTNGLMVFKVGNELHKKIKIFAVKHEITIKELIITALLEYIKNHN